MSHRLFNFSGDKDEYIEFLESKIRHLTAPHGQEYNPLAKETSISVPNEREFVYCNFQPGTLNRKEEAPQIAPWRRQLDEFVHLVCSEIRADDTCRPAGIGTPERNHMALRLLLGHSNAAAFHEVDRSYPLSLELPQKNRSMLERGYQYASFIAGCMDDRNFAMRVAGFQGLVFYSYCAVIVKSNPRPAVNDMMRAYTGKNLDDKTLDMYRHGAVWANRCIAALLENGWGHKAWEAFLYKTPSSAQLSRFASKDATSFQLVAHNLGRLNAPLWEDGWIPYCIPCIVHYLSGSEIPLEEICNILGYGPVLDSTIRPIANHFMAVLRWLLAGYDNSVIQPRETLDIASFTLENGATLQFQGF